VLRKIFEPKKGN